MNAVNGQIRADSDGKRRSRHATEARIADAVRLKRERFVGELSFVAGQFEHVAEQLDVAGALLDIAAREHARLRLDGDIDGRFGDLAEQAGVIDETRHIGGHEAIDHAAHADDLAGENARVIAVFE